ncbi:MAG: LPP20 family lipoprotein, partial [Campylobacterota bacterium]|nr:LPP20 family lipoprotein [Campylobacterota bacterium]
MFQRLKILIILLLPIYLYATPAWFYNLPSKSYEIIGYGIDENLQTARDMAKAEISKTIKIKILSNSNINKSLTNDKYKKSFKSNISTSTDATLQGIKILKEEYKNNKWYVFVKYDNRTLLQKIKSKYPNFKESNLKDMVNLQLVRKDTNWYLRIDKDLFLLNSSDFIKMFSNIDSKDINFTTNQKIYSYPDIMSFEINTKQKGYISILYSEQSGKVGIILDNKKIDKKLTYPKKSAENQLIVYNPTKNTLTEIYICIYSKDKIDLREFEQISNNLLDESNYNFDKLLDIIKDKEFSTIKLKIR